MSKLSFKREERTTGLASVASPYSSVQIKSDRKRCGLISAPSRFGHDDWRIRLMIVDAAENCGWKWATLKAVLKTEADAREWVKANWAAIEARYTLHSVAD